MYKREIKHKFPTLTFFFLISVKSNKKLKQCENYRKLKPDDHCGTEG